MINVKKKPNTASELKKILNPIVEKWFFSRFEEFSLPQKFAVMDIHSRKNILVSAPTGATKTLTAFLSILNELVDSSTKGILEDKIYCVYVSPLKALNRDIEKNLQEPLEQIQKIAGKDLGIRVGLRTGDTTSAEKAKMLKHSPHILITTPESLAILLTSPKFREKFRHVQWCIVDEIHALADNKRGVHLSLSMERMQLLSPGMTRVGLSATVAPLQEIAKFLVGNGRKCEVVDVQFIKMTDLKVLSPVKDLINVNYEELSRKTYELIDKLIQKHKTTLIFTNTRSATERVVHHLKERFPKNYYEIDEGPPSEVSSLIGAHHGSLSREHRHKIEDALKKGKLKAVVSSTSLELGIDIGYIDLVILLGSPKSVARTMQRIGRAGHQLHAVTKGRFIVMDRDDLVECSMLLKYTMEKNIDKVHIPTNCLDVLAQQVMGMALERVWEDKELFDVLKKSYCFKDLEWNDYDQVLSYLAGEYALEDRHIYARIWYDRDERKLGKKGKMTRVLYMTNIGTIPDTTGVAVKNGSYKIGMIDEGFLEKLRPGDIFVLGGECYQYKYSRGMVAQVKPAPGRRPTVPSWYSESLPLSFDIAMGVQKFRLLMKEKFDNKLRKDEVIKFIHDYLYVDKNAAHAIYLYFKQQYNYAIIPNKKELLIENYTDEKGKKIAIFHSLYGRRVNDALSRALALTIAKTQHRDVEIGVNDNGFYLSYQKEVNAKKAFELLNKDNFYNILKAAVDRSEVMKRRFRHCAARALMILRSYKGKTKRVGRQQVSSMILMAAVRRISDEFFILKEARREVMEDLMDVDNALKVVKDLTDKKIKVKEIKTIIPTPFAFNLVVQGYSDLLKMEDKTQFLQRMHAMVLAKIGMNKNVDKEDFNYHEYFEEYEENKDYYKDKLKFILANLRKVDDKLRKELVKAIETGEVSSEIKKLVEKYKMDIEESWP
ncbi:ATP-dependent helicase, partial [Candidatus Woesearchaeota archaeon]